MCRCRLARRAISFPKSKMGLLLAFSSPRLSRIHTSWRPPASPNMTSKGRYFLIPSESYPSLEQAGIILKSSQKKELAGCFMEFLREPEIVELMKQYGFERPNGVAKMGIIPKKTGKGDESLNKPCSCCR